MEDIGDVMVSHLSLEMHIWYHVIKRIFIPKMDRFDFISVRELAMMYHLVLEIPLNVLGIVMIMKRYATEKVILFQRES